MSDNGSGYVSRAWRATYAALGLQHLRTRPYTPRTNGKAERFIQTLLREWAYVEPYASPRSVDRSSDPISVLQPPATPREPRLSGSLVAAHERCVMNNVLELNS
jgi:transposase InsO family protein